MPVGAAQVRRTAHCCDSRTHGRPRVGRPSGADGGAAPSGWSAGRPCVEVVVRARELVPGDHQGRDGESQGEPHHEPDERRSSRVAAFRAARGIGHARHEGRSGVDRLASLSRPVQLLLRGEECFVVGRRGGAAGSGHLGAQAGHLRLEPGDRPVDLAASGLHADPSVDRTGRRRRGDGELGCRGSGGDPERGLVERRPSDRLRVRHLVVDRPFHRPAPGEFELAGHRLARRHRGGFIVVEGSRRDRVEGDVGVGLVGVGLGASVDHEQRRHGDG